MEKKQKKNGFESQTWGFENEKNGFESQTWGFEIQTESQTLRFEKNAKRIARKKLVSVPCDTFATF